jgi:hypothetical protein
MNDNNNNNYDHYYYDFKKDNDYNYYNNYNRVGKSTIASKLSRLLTGNSNSNIDFHIRVHHVAFDNIQTERGGKSVDFSAVTS